MAETDVVGSLKQYFADMLMPRSQGLVTVTPMKPNPVSSRHPRDGDDGFVVCLAGCPFLEIIFEGANIKLLAGFPSCVATWSELRKIWVPSVAAISPLPTKPNLRRKFIATLSSKKIGHGENTLVDLFRVDAVQRAEFLVQTIITRVKYMVSNKRHTGLTPKEDLDLTGLLEFATREYQKKCC